MSKICDFCKEDLDLDKFRETLINTKNYLRNTCRRCESIKNVIKKMKKNNNHFYISPLGYNFCLDCKIDWPIGEFLSDSYILDGHKYICKHCINKRTNNKISLKDQRKLFLQEMKHCNKCLRTLSISDFSKNNKSFDKLSHMCNDCSSTYQCNRYELKEIQRNHFCVLPGFGYCSACKIVKEEIFFSKNKRFPSGLNNTCKSCVNKYLENKKLPKYTEKLCNQCSLIKSVNSFRKRTGYYESSCKECEKKLRKERMSIPEIRKEVYSRENKYRREKMANDPVYNLKIKIRNRVRECISRKLSFSTKVENLLGCSLEDFKQHLESQFVAGMSWKNIGKIWHLDHIIPCGLFNFLYVESQFLCFNYKNYQPLFGEDNQNKSDILPDGSRAQDYEKICNKKELIDLSKNWNGSFDWIENIDITTKTAKDLYYPAGMSKSNLIEIDCSRG